MSARVLLTGGAGFIGSHTVDRLLEAGARVRVLDNLHPQVHPGGRRPPHLSPDVELIVGDVRDLDTVRAAVRGVTHVVHLAAETSVGQSMFQSDHHIDVNVRGTAVLFRALREERIDLARLLLSSSRAVYGEGAHHCERCGTINPGPRRDEDLAVGLWGHRCPECTGPLHSKPTPEDLPLRYSSAYGMTKLFQEQVAAAESEQLGIPLVVLRYFNVYGPRQSLDNPYTGLIMTLALRLLGRRPIVLYEGGTPVRDFVHVGDVVTANLRVILGPVPQARTFNIGHGTGVTLTRLAEELGEAFGRAPIVEATGRYRLGDIHAAVADLSRAEALLGYRPSLGIGAGLRTLVGELESAGAEDRSEAVEEELRGRGVLRG